MANEQTCFIDQNGVDDYRMVVKDGKLNYIFKFDDRGVLLDMFADYLIYDDEDWSKMEWNIDGKIHTFSHLTSIRIANTLQKWMDSYCTWFDERLANGLPIAKEEL